MTHRTMTVAMPTASCFFSPGKDQNHTPHSGSPVPVGGWGGKGGVGGFSDPPLLPQTSFTLYSSCSQIAKHIVLSLTSGPKIPLRINE